MVATLAMLKRRAQNVWLLLPETAAPFADAVLQMNADWGVNDIGVGLVTEGPEPSLTVTATATEPPSPSGA